MNISFDLIFGQKWRMVWHVVFWVSALGFFSFIFGQQSRDLVSTLYFVVPLIIITMLTSWFINYFLFPRFLAKGRYLRLAGYAMLTFVVSVWLETIVVVPLRAAPWFRPGA